MNYRVKDRTGDRCGKLTVIEYARSKNGKAAWVCKCDCGNDIIVEGHNLNRQKSCGCSRMPRVYLEGTRLSRTFWKNLKSSAKKRGLEVSITPEFIDNLFTGKCALTGWDISLDWEEGWESCTASLDRIDSSKGYTEDNIQWVHKYVNRMKAFYPNEYFIEVCKAVARNLDEGSQELACSASGSCEI